MDDAPRFARMPSPLLFIAAAVVAVFLFAAANPGAADARGKKVHACVTKKGPDKGTMRFSRTAKCHKGEKRISWNKKGKRGKQGPAGPAGERGPQGPSGVTDELLNTIASQQATIDQLTSQVNTLTQQLNGLSPTIAALCTQMDAVTDQSNALGTVISGIALSGLIPAGLGLTVPAVPAALGSFACPT